MSFGSATDPLPGILSVSWGDLFVDLPGTYQIARLTFPIAVFPEIDPASITSQVVPSAIAFIPDIPEPGVIGWTSTIVSLFLRRRVRVRHLSHSATCEPLEDRHLLSFSASFPGGATLLPRVDTNASNTSNLTEGEAVIAVSPNADTGTRIRGHD